MLVEMFPGQGGKQYNSATPEVELLYDTLEHHQRLLDLNPNVKPRFLFGHSYGLYTALVVGGVATVAIAIELARRRADLVRKAEAEREERGEERTGMLAILGPTTEKVEAMARELGLVISNYNGPAANVLAGAISKLREVQQTASDRIGRCKTAFLPFEGAYHTAIRTTESIVYARQLGEFELRRPGIPFISSTRPRILETVSDIVEELAGQMYRPVDLAGVVNVMWDRGISIGIDSGPGSLVKRLLSRAMPGNNLMILSLEEDSATIARLVS